ncbi:ABC transporter substrate-binding protein [Acidaminobacter hydrogenoformans]|uniref:Osmoprotectant transport system substrate-binding protein n=1 Tax=Acidaminobacter hydrogenoformans DSM 2784 TaxID=1120920 RepID=A0A1G5S690_9FIRM|nr:glycine betaine ABC transporter substrate-binding protein [Acidaminobacter hydrogenoformans]SCZ81865.1 osmoprotectant transport system substrate-binding protein [Acidaminobacter hydrogenoformans DSM 2784]
MKIFKRLLLTITAALMLVSLAACGQAADEPVKIGHKNFTEQRILGQMFAELIESKTDLTAEVTEFGGTNIVFEALKSNEVNIYPEYTGTAYGSILNQTELNDPQEVYDYVKNTYKEEFNIEWGIPMGFNNTYTFAVRPEIAEEYNLKTFSDLSGVASELRLVAAIEFLERADGLPGVQQTYGGFEFKQITPMDPGLRYAAIDQKESDVMDAFSTDGKLIEFGLVVLEDDKQFFPPYYAAPLLNGEFSEAHPEVAELLLTLADQISDEEMQQMNYEVDNLGTNEREVAKKFLQSKGLID